MSRILVDLGDEDITALDTLAQANGRSRAAELRDAVSMYLRRQSDGNWIVQGSGYWAAPPEGGNAGSAD